MNATANYFESLNEALNAAYGRATAAGAEFDAKEVEAWFDSWNPGVGYGQTISRSVLLFKWKGRISYRYALTAVVYRMENGRYELTSYIA